MPIKHKLYYCLAGLHLAMIVLFATHFAAWGPLESKTFKAVITIGNYTGSNNIFSFFAPGLSNQPYVIYTLQDTIGKEKLVDFTGRSPDFTNRINDIYGYLTIEESRSVLSVCLAQAVMKQYPNAKKIRVSMVVQYIPSMQEYRHGKRSTWHFWFSSDYERRPLKMRAKCFRVMKEFTYCFNFFLLARSLSKRLAFSGL
jgi:hypothetical protein